MSGLEVVAAVSAVISAFHGGSELLKHLKKKRRNARTQAQQEFEERQLQDSLETGKQQIECRYAQDMKELGDYIRVGDAIARDRLLHIAIVLQAEIIKSLQTAVKHENAILNLKILHEASIMNRKDTFVTLDELKQRILISRPLTRPLLWAPNDPTSRSSVTSMHTIQSKDFPTVGSTPYDNVPMAVTPPVPKNPNESRQGLARYFQMKRNKSTSSSSVASSSNTPVQTTNFNVSVALEHMVKTKGTEDRATIMKDIDEIISSYQSLHIDHDSGDRLNEHQQPARQDDLAISNADSTISNNDAMQLHQNLTCTSDKHRMNGSLHHPALDQDTVSSQEQQQLYNYQWNVARNSFPYMDQQLQSPRRTPTSISSVTQSNTYTIGRNNSTSSQNSHAQTPPLSPRTEQSCFSLQPIPSNAPYQKVNNQHGVYSPPLTSYALIDQTYTLPIVPFSPQQSRQSTAAPPHLSQQTNTFAASPTSSKQLSTSTTMETNDSLNLRPYLHLTTSIARDASCVHTGQSKCITTSAMCVAAAANAPANAGLRHDSASAPSRTSTDSGLSVSIGVLPGSSGLRSSIPSNAIENGLTNSHSMMDGRPCKDNNYWGFCKGAWAVREDVKKGFALRTLPQGYYNTKTVWECQSCTFKGDTFFIPHPTKKNKKDVIIDPHVYTSKAGIRYRWIFLAKSHARKKSPENPHDESEYGCVFCSAEGSVTLIHKSVEALLSHIWEHHIANMSETTRSKTKCVLGRIAADSEAFDINFPIFS